MKKYNYLDAYIKPGGPLLTQQGQVMPLKEMIARAERGERLPEYPLSFDDSNPDDDSDFDCGLVDDPFAEFGDVFNAEQESLSRLRQSIDDDKKKKTTNDVPES